MTRYAPEQFDIETGVPLAPDSDMPISAYRDNTQRPTHARGPAGIRYNRRNVWPFYLCCVALILFCAWLWRPAANGAPAVVGTPSSEAQLVLQERRIAALATRVVELEIRVQKSADAAAGYTAPGPAVTSTPIWSYSGPMSAGVTPPEYLPSPVRDGIGDRPR